MSLTENTDRIDWKAIRKAVIETLKSIGRGDIILRMRADKLFPYILYAFIIGWISIWMNYNVEQTMIRIEKNRKVIENLKIYNTHLSSRLVSMDRVSTVEQMLEAAGSDVRTPEKPAEIITR